MFNHNVVNVGNIVRYIVSICIDIIYLYIYFRPNRVCNVVCNVACPHPPDRSYSFTDTT